MPRLLHVGCGPKRKDQTTPGFRDPAWIETRLDIEPSVRPDIVASITDMGAIESGSFDAVFSSHNIEHLFAHEVPRALAEFARVLRPEGFAVITCPDLRPIARLVAEDKLTEPAYISRSGPITPLDMLFGHGASIRTGQVYMAHRCGFTRSSLAKLLHGAGFATVVMRERPAHFDLWAYAAKIRMPEAEARAQAGKHF